MNYKLLLLGVFIIALFVWGGYQRIAPKAEQAMQDNLNTFVQEQQMHDRVDTSETVTDESTKPTQEDTSTSVTLQQDTTTSAKETTTQTEEVAADDSVVVVEEVIVEDIPDTSPTTSGYTLAEVQLHADASSCWTAVDGKVYDLTSFIKKHPGGAKNIMKICGIDGTTAFEKQHGGENRPENTLDGFYIGDLL